MRNESAGVLKVNYGAANFPTSAHGPFINGDQVIIAGTGTALDSTPVRQYLVANSSGGTFTSTLAPAVPDRMSSLARTTLMPAISVAQCTLRPKVTAPEPLENFSAFRSLIRSAGERKSGWPKRIEQTYC